VYLNDVGSPHEGTGNGKYLGCENLHGDGLDRDARRRHFLRYGNRPGPGKERYRRPDRPRAGARKETADPRPFGRTAADRRPGRIRRRGQFRPEDPRPIDAFIVGQREEIAAIVKDKPKIDLEINFDYNSADISAKSLPSVQALGRALTNNDLKGSTFVVAGHTDAAGGEGYNQDLSERRADAIKRYLVDKYGINGTDLVTVGYGKSKLKDPSQPVAEVNRRVQVVNMENKATASNAAK